MRVPAFFNPLDFLFSVIKKHSSEHLPLLIYKKEKGIPIVRKHDFFTIKSKSWKFIMKHLCTSFINLTSLIFGSEYLQYLLQYREKPSFLT